MGKYALALALALLPAIAAAAVPDRAWQHRRDMVQSAWRTFGPGAPVATLAAQIHQESAWRCDAVSWAGAQGCAQFMPGTSGDAAKRWPSQCAPANPFHPPWAFRCRDLYLRAQIIASRNERTDECDEWAFGLRAYNGGLGWIRRDRAATTAAGADPDDWRQVQPYNAGRRDSAFRENTEYPVRIFRLESEYVSWGRALGC